MFNLKLALRTLFKSPFVTAIAIVSLALGIGANGAIFSLFDQLLLRPLPVVEPDRLVNLGAPGPKQGSTSCNSAGDCDEILSYPMFRDLEQQVGPETFTGLAAHRLFGANLALAGQTLSGQGVLVSGSYFPTLGLTPALGRLLSPDDDKVVGESHVVVLSHDYWRRRFDQRPDVLDETLLVNGYPLLIVGVAPAGFRGTTLGTKPEVFVPITLRGLMAPGFDGFENRRSYWVYAFGRLTPGVALAQAQTALNVPYRSLINEVEAPLQEGLSEQTLARFRSKTLTLAAGEHGQSSLRHDARAPISLLFAVAGVVLLIACANIANLLLARAASRQGEIAVRLSIGASRRRLISQLLTEACVLAVLGGMAGLLVALWTLQLISRLLPAEIVATLDLGLDLPLIGFAALLSLGTGLLFGLFPALHSTRMNLATSLKGQAGQPAGARAAARFRASLVTAQIALSLALLVSAGLFTKSLLNVSRLDLGLEIEHIITFGISPELNRYETARTRQLIERTEEQLAALPGVNGVTTALVPLLAGSNWGNSVHVQGFDSTPDTDRHARFNSVGAGYFRTLGIPLLAGRELTTADTLEAPKVAVVNEAFAEKFNLPGRQVVGKRMSDGGDGEELDVEIVGLVKNAKYSEVKGEIPPLYFTPYRQYEDIGAINFYVRTSQAPTSVFPDIRRVMAQLDPNLPLENFKTMPQQVRENVYVDRVLTALSTGFAVLATLLAAVGLYGVLAYTVAQRTRELGLRIALGANASRVQRMVLWQVGKLTIVGGVIGIAAALALGKAARSQLFGLGGHDPVVLLGATVLLVAVALGAGLVPAVKASRIDPMRALRHE